MENDGASWLEKRDGQWRHTLHIFIYRYIYRILYESNNLCIALERDAQTTNEGGGQ